MCPGVPHSERDYVTLINGHAGVCVCVCVYTPDRRDIQESTILCHATSYLNFFTFQKEILKAYKLVKMSSWKAKIQKHTHTHTHLRIHTHTHHRRFVDK